MCKSTNEMLGIIYILPSGKHTKTELENHHAING